MGAIFEDQPLSRVELRIRVLAATLFGPGVSMIRISEDQRKTQVPIGRSLPTPPKSGAINLADMRPTLTPASRRGRRSDSCPHSRDRRQPGARAARSQPAQIGATNALNVYEVLAAVASLRRHNRSGGSPPSPYAIVVGGNATVVASLASGYLGTPWHIATNRKPLRHKASKASSPA